MTTYLLGAIVRLWGRLAKGGINKEERGRARSIAAASAPLHGEALAPEEEAFVQAHHEIYVEYVTAEQPALLYAAPPKRVCVRREIGRRVAAQQRLEAHRRAFEANPLGIDMPAELETAVMAPAAQPVWDWESFTEAYGRSAADVERMVAEAKAANAR